MYSSLIFEINSFLLGIADSGSGVGILIFPQLMIRRYSLIFSLLEFSSLWIQDRVKVKILYGDRVGIMQGVKENLHHKWIFIDKVWGGEDGVQAIILLLDEERPGLDLLSV